MILRKLIVILFLFLVFLSPVKAEEINCPYEEQLRLRELAASVTFSFDLIDYGEFMAFDVYASGMTKDLFIKEEHSLVRFYYNEDAKKINSSVLPGTIHKLDFYATAETKCPNFKIINRYLQAPYYNRYSEHPLCIGHEQYSLCQRFSNIYTLINDKEEFEDKMNVYLESLKLKDDHDLIEEPNDNNWFNNIVLFIQKYYLILLLLALAVLIGNIVFTKIKKRRSIL